MQENNELRSNQKVRYYNVIELAMSPIEIRDMSFQRDIHIVLKNGITRKISFISDYKQALQFGGA